MHFPLITTHRYDIWHNSHDSQPGVLACSAVASGYIVRLWRGAINLKKIKLRFDLKVYVHLLSQLWHLNTTGCSWECVKNSEQKAGMKKHILKVHFVLIKDFKV